MNITDCEQLKFKFNEDENKEESKWKRGWPDHDGLYFITVQPFDGNTFVTIGMYSHNRRGIFGEWRVFLTPHYDRWRETTFDDIVTSVVAWMPLDDILPEPYCKEVEE